MEAQMPKMPEINPADKKKEEKKKGGVFADLFGRGASATIGTPGLGAGSFVSGLLASKAGMIALAVVGATVFGAMGLIGYKFFGPGGADRAGGQLSLFAEKPPQAQGTDAGAGTANGNSDSLTMAAQANQAPAAPADQTTADAAASASAAADASKTDADKAKADADKAAASNKSASAAATAMAAAKARKGGLAAKFGSPVAGAGGSSSGAAAGGGPLKLASARTGTSGAISNGGARAKAGGMRGAFGKGSAGQQLLGVSRDQRGAKTSAAAGSTYDGNPQSGLAAGASDGGRGAGVQGSGSGAGGDTQSPTLGAPQGNNLIPPPQAGIKNMTPWQNAINTAMALMAGAVLLIFLASKVKNTPPWGTGAAVALCAIAALLGIMVAKIGNEIANGPYGQVFQGQMFAAAGTFLAASSLGMAAASTMSAPPAILMAGIVLSGAAAIGMGLMAMFTPTTSYPPSTFKTQEGGLPPDWDIMHGSHGHALYKFRGKAPAGSPIADDFIV